LLERSASVDIRNRDGETALLKAAEEGHTAIVELLAAASADIHAEDRRGRTALAVAAERAYADLIETLSTLGAGLDPENARRLVENAERNGWTDVVELLRRVPERS
jgi:ankyrin repeat protein